ncbi:MAG: chromosomal replication initiator protein DnaA, partial [Bacteroidota bacterium]|nr:chromosomal replication initiator protein DnaA [Bacteroidota bacterium]
SNKYNDVWNNCLSNIKDNVPSVSFKTWFEPIVPLKLENKILTIQVPSPFFYEYLEEQYIDILRKTIRQQLGPEGKLEYNIVIENNSFSNKKPYTVKFPTKNNSGLTNYPISLPISSDQNVIKNPFIIPGLKKLEIAPQLNPDNSFSNFIEGDCNKLARSASYAVAGNPGGTAFNPLFLYGESGLGKTHLSQAIGIEVKQKFPDKIVLYVAASKFRTQFVDAVRNNNANDFLHFYQMIDVLILDDVHELAGKEKTQETFFQIFNHLHQTKKQLILTSDKSPVDLDGIEQRLISRFKWGLSADLQTPDFETRFKILKSKVYNDGIELNDDILEFVATHIKDNVRELEGALISLLAQSTLNKKEITIELARDLIEKLIKSSRREVSIGYIQKVVCDYFQLPAEALHAKTRKREIVQARQIAMFFSKGMTKLSLSSIGAQIGGKDHATVLHACRTVSNLCETDKKFKGDVREIERNILL